MRVPSWASAIITGAMVAGTAAALVIPTGTAGVATQPLCERLAWEMHAAQDYVPTADVQACFGQEDDDRVTVALLTGQTVRLYMVSHNLAKPV